MAVFLVALSNIKKKKGVAFSMGLLILLAAAMFNVGVTLFAGIGHFYDSENDRLMGSHYRVRFIGNEYSEDYLDYFILDERTEMAQTDEIALMDMAQFPEGGAMSLNFFRMENEGAIKGYVLEKKAGVPDEEAIYIPTFMKQMGYEPGDVFTLVFNKKEYSFRVAGYSQSTWFSSSVSSLSDIYMPDAAFEKLYGEIGGGYMLSVRLKDASLVEQMREDFKNQTDVRIEAIAMDAKVMDFSVNDMRNGSTMVVTILAAVLFAFSFLMVVVAVIVMRYRILNHIDSQMVSIGAMQAIGYTGKQIKWSIALEFLLIGLLASVLGIAFSYGVIGALGWLITSSVGVNWRSGGHVLFDFLSVLAVMGILLLVCHFTAAKAAKVLPVTALKGGMKSHSFKKTYFPLEHLKGGLVFTLGMKQVLYQKKLFGMISAIFAGITFACAFAVIIWQNMGLNDELVLKLTGYEISDIMIYTAPHADYEKLKHKIEAMDGVRKTSLYEMKSVKAEGELLAAYVSDDFGKLEMVSVYEGDFPIYDNEIVVTGVLAKQWGKEIGDTVRISVLGVEHPFVICGLTQTMNNFGHQCFLSEQGMKKVNPHYEKNTIQVYLQPDLDVQQMIKRMEEEFYVLSPTDRRAERESGQTVSPDGEMPVGGNASKEVDAEADKEAVKEAAKEAAARVAEEKISTLLSKYGVDSAQYALMVDGEIILKGDTAKYEINRIENNRAMFVTNVNSVASAVGLMSSMILAGTACMILLIFYMVVKSMLIRQKTEFGIFKAIGYTDRQLMRMIGISFLPSAIIGAFLGCILAGLSVNPLSSALFSLLGISKMEFVISPWVLGGIAAGIVLFAYAAAVASAIKIKGITVYGLLTGE